MKIRKKRHFFVLVLFVGIALYNFCVFILIKKYTNVFWGSYIFTMLAFLIQIFLPFILSKDTDIRRDRFLEVPFMIYSGVYLIVQLSISIVFMLIPFSFKVTLIVQIIVLALFFMITLISLFGKEHVAGMDTYIQRTSGFIRDLTMKAENLYNSEMDEVKKAELKKLYEVIRYSDPMGTTREICSLDEQINNAFNLVSSNIDRKSLQELKGEIKDLADLVAKRNAFCKSSK